MSGQTNGARNGGALAQLRGATGGDVVKASAARDPMQALIQQSTDGLLQAMGDQRVVERFQRVALTLLRTDEKLADAARKSPQSFIASLLKAAQLDLSVDPALREGYLVPAWNSKVKRYEVALWFGYQGLRKLALRDASIKSVRANVVYDVDAFDFLDGTEAHVHHRPNLRERGNVLCAYAVAEMADGTRFFRVLRRWELDDAMRDAITVKKSDGTSYEKSNTPWHTHPEAMYEKTALRRLIWRDLPLLPEVAAALEQDDERRDGRMVSVAAGGATESVFEMEAAIVEDAPPADDGGRTSRNVTPTDPARQTGDHGDGEPDPVVVARRTFSGLHIDLMRAVLRKAVDVDTADMGKDDMIAGLPKAMAAARWDLDDLREKIDEARAEMRAGARP